MSLFVADLAFTDPGEGEMLDRRKRGILAASVIAGGLGYVVLRRVIARGDPSPPPTADR